MEEKELVNESDSLIYQEEEPVQADNSSEEKIEDEGFSSEEVSNIEGQSIDVELDEQIDDAEKDPSQELILGKFKTVDDLTKAYEELQKRQGQSSEELGNLRKEISGVNEFKEQMNFFNSKKDEYYETILRDKAKYSKPEYFEDPTFREIYKEALLVYGANLDTDRMIDLVEQYVATRIKSYEKNKLAQKETQNLLDSMDYAKNPKSNFIPPKKTFDEMTAQEVDELLERLI